MLLKFHFENMQITVIRVECITKNKYLVVVDSPVTWLTARTRTTFRPNASKTHVYRPGLCLAWYARQYQAGPN